MTLMEFVASIKKENPQFLDKLPEKKAAALVRQVLATLAQQVGSVEEGVVKIQGFGVFNVRKVVRKKGGEEVTVRQVVFRAAKVKPDGKI